MTGEEWENVPYYDALAPQYDLFFSDLERNMEEEGDWLARLLQSHGAHTVLDASCGAGRQAIPLRERGFNVTAADPSTAMLDRAEATARRHGITLPTLKAGFVDLSAHFRGEFDAVIALGNGLCNLSAAEPIQRALRSLYECCRPGGICLIGIKDFEAIKQDGGRFHGHQIADEDGRRTILFEVWDFADPVLISTAYVLSHSSEDNRVSATYARTREYMLHAAELCTLATNVGFDQVQRLDHPSEAAFSLHRPATSDGQS